MLFISKLSSNTSGIVIWRSHNGDSNPITKEEKMSEMVSKNFHSIKTNKIDKIKQASIFLSAFFLSKGLSDFFPPYGDYIADFIFIILAWAWWEL